MFNLQFSEIVMVLILALVLLGPKRLPQVARMLARGLREIRKASQDLKDAWESEVEGSIGDDDLRALRTLRDPGALVDDAWSVPAPVARGSTAADASPEAGSRAGDGEDGDPGARPGAGASAASNADEATTRKSPPDDTTGSSGPAPGTEGGP